MTEVRREVIDRARASLGQAHPAIHATVLRLLESRGARGTVADVGCGTGDFCGPASALFERIIGIDAVRYPGLPAAIEWHCADVDDAALPLETSSVDAAVAIEVIEHVENPRALCRELARVTRPGGHVVVSTPNQSSLLSILTLLVKGQFPAFQEGEYPAHRTALLPIDLCRIFTENGLVQIEVAYTGHGRLPLSGAHYPPAVAALWPRGLSDNVAIVGHK
jgi:2-polyprenyl-3-methyl-5-hydroxy-6-metoxy-1,4-benzoquinol methylase